MCPWGKERLAVLSEPPAFGVLHCVLRKNLLSQLDMKSQWFSTSPFFRLTSPEHQCSEGRICGFLWRQSLQPSVLEETVAKIPTYWHAKAQAKKDQQAQGRAGGSSWRVMVLVWNGLGTSGEPCLRFVVPHWPKFHEARICHPALGAVETARGPSSNVQWTISSDPQWRGRHAAELPHTSLLWAHSHEYQISWSLQLGLHETRGQSHGSGAWLSVGLMPFINNICDFCPGSYFLNPDCHWDLPQMWCNFCI